MGRGLRTLLLAVKKAAKTRALTVLTSMPIRKHEGEESEGKRLKTSGAISTAFVSHLAALEEPTRPTAEELARTNADHDQDARPV